MPDSALCERRLAKGTWEDFKMTNSSAGGKALRIGSGFILGDPARRPRALRGETAPAPRCRPSGAPAGLLARRGGRDEDRRRGRLLPCHPRRSAQLTCSVRVGGREWKPSIYLENAAYGSCDYRNDQDASDRHESAADRQEVRR